MTLDIRSLLVALATNLFIASLLLPLIMGRVSRAARRAQASMLLQALAWGLLLASSLWRGLWPDHLLSTLSMAALGASWVALWQALEAWLGPRPWRRTLWALALLTPVGYGLGFGHYPFRVGWANTLLAGQLLIVLRATLWPVRAASLRWRALIGACCATLAVVTLWRGVLGAFFTPLYPTFLTPHPVNVASALVSNVTLVLTLAALLVAWREEAERALQSLAMTDPLTGALNRRAWQQRATELLAHAQRYRQPLAVLMIDLDHFKQVNDRHGHDTGDRALVLTAELLRAKVRRGDPVGRYGGEEFCVVLQHADLAAARHFDQRLRQRLHLRAEQELGLRVDYSAGLALLDLSAPPVEPEAALEHLLHQADRALYEAKRRGRGCLVEADEPVYTLPAWQDTARTPSI